MSREKIKTYRYTCNGMKFVTHAEDGREYGMPMVALCGETAEFCGTNGYAADHVAIKAGWKVLGSLDLVYRCPGVHSEDGDES
jgi:hypothetical protein